MQVFISDPGRKKGRTDAGANQKELYVAGLSRFTKELDLKRLFEPVSLFARSSSKSFSLTCHSLNSTVRLRAFAWDWTTRENARDSRLSSLKRR